MYHSINNLPPDQVRRMLRDNAGDPVAEAHRVEAERSELSSRALSEAYEAGLLPEQHYGGTSRFSSKRAADDSPVGDVDLESRLE